MLTRTTIPAIILGVILSIVIPFANPAIVSAQTCYDAAGAPIACPDKKKEKRPTVIYPSYTPTSTVTPTATLRPTSTLTPTATFDSAGAGLMPPDRVQDSPNSRPYIGFGMILIVSIGGGLFLYRRRFMGDGADQGRESPTKFGRESPTMPPGPPTKPSGDEQGFIIEGGMPPGPPNKFGRESPTQPPGPPIKPGGGDEQGFIVEDGKPAGDGSVKGFIVEDGKSLPEPHMQPGEVDDPNIKPGQIAGMDDWEMPDSEQGIGNPDFHPGAQEPPEPNFSSKMGPQPHMQPGETQPPDPDLPSDIGIDNPNIKPPDVGVDNPDF